jgi:hypothetical protein
MSAQSPEDWNTSGNGDATGGPDGKFYVDGGMYVSMVRPEYPKRADAARQRRSAVVRRSVADLTADAHLDVAKHGRCDQREHAGD